MTSQTMKFLYPAAFPEETKQNQEPINEGIRFFKNSKRLTKLGNKIGHRAMKKGGTRGYNEVKEYVEKLEEISGKFTDMERKYKETNTKEDIKKIKADYEFLETDYEDLMEILKRQTFTTLTRAGFKLAVLATPLVLTYAHISLFEDFVQGALQRGGEDAVKDLGNLDTFKQSFGSGEDIATTAGEQATKQTGPIMSKLYDYALKIATFTGVVSLLNFINKQVTTKSLYNETRRAIDDLKRKEESASQQDDLEVEENTFEGTLSNSLREIRKLVEEEDEGRPKSPGRPSLEKRKKLAHDFFEGNAKRSKKKGNPEMPGYRQYLNWIKRKGHDEDRDVLSIKQYKKKI